MIRVSRSLMAVLIGLAMLSRDPEAQAPEPGRASGPAASSAAAVFGGRWTLAPGRSHYGVGATPRRAEHFACDTHLGALRCTIRSEFADGRHVMATFRAPANGGSGPVTGMRDMDSVRVVAVAPGIADATFSRGGRPVFAYRAYRGGDGRSLTIVAIHPVLRTALTSVIVYVRAP